MVEKIIHRLEKQYRHQARFQRYGSVILVLATILLFSAAGLVKLHSHKAIEQIEADAEIIARQDAVISRLEVTLEKQEQQLAEKDSIIAAQQKLITGQAGYMQALKNENDQLRKANQQLTQQIQDEADILDSPLNRLGKP